MRRWRITWGTVALVVSLAASWLVNKLSDDQWWAVAPLVLGIIGYGILDQHKARAEAERGWEERITAVCGLRGLVPVDTAVETWDGLKSLVSGGAVPRYVPRSFDQRLDALVRAAADAGGDPVLLVGDAKAGKTRAALEALRRSVPAGSVIVRPEGDLDAAALLRLCGDTVRRSGSAVVFIDDLHAARFRADLDPRVLETVGAEQGVVMVATMHRSGLSEPPASDVQIASSVRRDLIEYLVALHDRSGIDVPSRLDATELQAADTLFPDLSEADRTVLGETMAATPQLLQRFDNDHGADADDGRDIVRAAIDLVRLGAGTTVTVEQIQTFLRGRPYDSMGQHGQRLNPDQLSEAGFRWATTPIAHVHALLRLEEVSSPPRYLPFEPLADREARDRPLTADLIGSVGSAPEMLALLLQHLLNQGTLDSASEQLKAIARRRGPSAAWATLALGVLAEDRGDADGARTAYRQTIATGLSDMATTAMFNLGILEVQERNPMAARTAYEKTIATGHPEIAPAAMVNLGVLAEEHGSLDVARRYYRLAIDTAHPHQSPLAWYNLGILEESAGNSEAARNAYRHAIDTEHPRQAPKATVNLGLLDQAEGNSQAARTAYQRAIDTKHPDAAPWAKFNIALLEQSEGNLDAARTAYQRAIDTNHRDVVSRAMFNLGNLEWAEGRIDAARAAYQQAIGTNNTDDAPAAMVNLGILERTEGNPDAARTAYQQAINTNHHDQAPMAMVNLGILEQAEGNPDAARSAYQQAVKTGHTDAAARATQALSELRDEPDTE